MVTMNSGVLKRMQSMVHEDLPTREKTVQNGNLTLKSVPFVQRGKLGPDGESEYLTSDVMYRMAQIFEYMIKNRITEFDYNDFQTIQQ